MNEIRDPKAKIQVLVADDHTLFRHGISALLKAEPDMEVIGEVDNGRSAIEFVELKRVPDVILMDVNMPALNGIQAARQILKRQPSVKILMVTAYDHDTYLREVTEYAISGYVLKTTTSTELKKAIREVFKGNSYFSPSIAKRLQERLREAFTNGKPIEKEVTLTDREAEVLQLIAEGCANKQMADHLGISIKTIEKHRQQVMNKLNIHDVAGLTRYYLTKKGATFASQPHSSMNGNDSLRGRPRLKLDQQELLNMVVTGESDEQIAENLDIELSEVESRKQSLFQLIGTTDMDDLRAFALSEGIIDAPRTR